MSITTSATDPPHRAAAFAPLRLFARPTARTEIEADLDSLRDALREDGTA